MKDLIEITDKQGIKRQVELVTKFNLEDSEYNYIIYKELDNSHCYVAKYKGENIVSLETDLSKEEFALAKNIYRGVNG